MKRRSSGSMKPGGSSLQRDSCSGRHQTGTKPGEYGKPPVRRDCRTGGSHKRKRWAPVRRDHCARRARDQERAANHRAAERAVSLEIEVGDFGVINPRTNFSWSREHMEANCGSTLLSRTGVDQERMATHYSEELQWTTAGIRCRNSHLKSAPTGHCHTNDGAQTTRTFFSWREQTYIGKPQLSSSFSVDSTCILLSFSSQER